MNWIDRQIEKHIVRQKGLLDRKDRTGMGSVDRQDICEFFHNDRQITERWMSLDCGIEQERKIDREVELYRRLVVRRKKERREREKM